MVNNVTIMGRLTSDPELKQTPNGISNCSFNVAVDRNYAPQGQDRQTDFIPVVAWRQTAEFIARNFSKGKMIAIVGELQTRSYNDKRHSDVTHYVMEVKADRASFCGDKSPSCNSTPVASEQQTQQTQSAQPAQQDNYNYADFEGIIGDNNLPF